MFVRRSFAVLYVKFQRESMRPVKIGARDRSITKSYFISAADQPLKMIDQSAFKDDQTRSNTRLKKNTWRNYLIL